MGITCTCDYWKGEALCRKARYDASELFEHNEKCLLKKFLEAGAFYVYRNYKSFSLKEREK